MSLEILWWLPLVPVTSMTAKYVVFASRAMPSVV